MGYLVGSDKTTVLGNVLYKNVSFFIYFEEVFKMTGLNWLGYKVERVDCIDPIRDVQGTVYPNKKLVRLLHTAEDHVAIHENVHVWQHYKFSDGKYWELAHKLPYSIQPHEICARMVQYGKKTLQKSLTDLDWFVKAPKNRLAFLWQRQVRRAAAVAFEQAEAEGETIKELIVRENGIMLKLAGGGAILVILCGKANTEAYVATREVSYRFFSREQVYVRTTSRFKENVEGFIASIPRRL